MGAHMAYKQVDETFWTDPQVKRLKPLERYLFLYLITNHHTHYSGIYYLPLSYICQDTGMGLAPIRDGLATLADGCHVKYSEEDEIVWVVKMAKHQLKASNKENVISGIGNHLKTLHRSKLIINFLETYKDFNIPYTTPLGSHADGSATHEAPIAESVTVKGTVKGKEHSNSNGSCEEAFLAFYSLYPKKVGKEDAYKAFKKISPDEDLLRKMMVSLKEQSQSVKWLEEGGRFIPYPATWLNGKRWEDEVAASPDQVSPEMKKWYEEKAKRISEQMGIPIPTSERSE
jgi:hypothetical protein